MSKHSILLVDDQIENLSTTQSLLRIWGYQVDTITSPDAAVEMLKSNPNHYAVAILDYRMPGKSGIELAQEMRAFNDEVSILIYSAYPSVECLKATIRLGALDFIDKNEDLSVLKEALEKACKEFEKVRKVQPSISPTEVSRLIASIGMVGRSNALAEIAKQVLRYRQSKRPVLILGETGVGKELVAKALHGDSKLQMVVINCASLTRSDLVESQLFGYEKGAFTGATSGKAGVLETLCGGTIFLDELHYLDISTQGKLLRAIREKKIRRLGNGPEIDVDFRLISATSPKIEEWVAEGRFLADLYHRINYLTIHIPPLRERSEDIEPLVLNYSQKYFEETGKKKKLLQKTLRLLEQHDWPGNVGQLDGYLSKIFEDSIGEVIDENQLVAPVQKQSSTSLKTTFAQLEAKQEFEKRQMIEKAMNNAKSMRHAAEILGMRPSSLHTLITRLGMREKQQ